MEKLGLEQLLLYGKKDLSELLEVTNDLYKIRQMLKKTPMELINMGKYGNCKKDFIQKYGIDNIIALDEETGGMFSHPMWDDDIYLTLFAHEEERNPKLNIDNKLTYEEFKECMYEILLSARDVGGSFQSGYYPNYDFIQGKFREEHPEIFIDGDIDPLIKRKFYFGHISAQDVMNNPELIQLLQGKDLSKVFLKTMTVEKIMTTYDKYGNANSGINNTVNMAQYLSEQLGQKEFLKICASYGKCLDNIEISTKNEVSVESITETIEQAIYMEIKQRGMDYFEKLPISFKKKHPELFLPKEIDEELRNKFYKGKLSFEDIKQNPQIKEIILTKDISVGFLETKLAQEVHISLEGKGKKHSIWDILTKETIMDLAQEYGKYLEDVNADIFKGQSIEERKIAVQDNIEENILNRKSSYDETVPEFFKKKYPEMFLDENSPNELKEVFYDNKIIRKYCVGVIEDVADISFQLIKEHPEWREFLDKKDLSRAFAKQYEELFKRFDSSTLLELGTRYPKAIEEMVENHRESVLENWYKSTGGRFIPHHIVMLYFPEDEIDSFLSNSKRWSKLMKIDDYNLNDDGKTAILKASYAMGVFQDDDDGFNKTMKLFTDIPKELSQEEYEKVMSLFNDEFDLYRWNKGNVKFKQKFEEMKSLFEKAYTLNDENKYVLSIDKQKNKESVKILRETLERAKISKILTPEKAHQIFDSFAMEYNLDFVRFFNDNIEEILSNPEYLKNIATMQRQFKDIVRTNIGRRLTLDVAQDYIKNIGYSDVEVGNEGVAEQAKIVGYSQKDFETIQNLFNEGETRDFSSIPRIQGKTNGYTYEMLRCDDPLALTIGTLTDCCQEIHGAGQTSMEHSVVSPDGRVFCVRDNEGRIVAQSWFWRNQYTGCFDNIEIPYRIFKLYEKKHPNVGREGLTADILEVYKKAAKDLMQEDEKVYKELLENRTISKEQYDALLLGKVTIGLGYNDIADAIQYDKTIHQDNDIVSVKGTNKLPRPYTDANVQYTIAQRDKIVKSKYENLYIHQDDVPVYDGTNISSTVLLTMKRMEQETRKKEFSRFKQG